MSVIFFGADELAQIVAVCTRERYPVMEREDLETIDLCASLATISEANALCYEYRYNSPAVAHTAQEIRTQIKMRSDDSERAFGTVRLLAYNAIEDKNYLTEVEGGHEAHAHVLQCVLRVMMDRLESQQRSIDSAHEEIIKARELHASRSDAAQAVKRASDRFATLQAGKVRR